MTLPLPIDAVIGGVEVVILEASHYRALMGDRSGSLKADPDYHIRRMCFDLRSKKGSSSSVLDDEEVAIFLIRSVVRTSQEAAREACIQRFGLERSPSRSGLNRFTQRVRVWLMAHPGVLEATLSAEEGGIS